MDASCINAQGRLAWFPTSNTPDASGFSLLGKISVNVKGDPAHLSSAHFSQTAVLARAYFGGMTIGAPQREQGSVLGSVIRHASTLELLVHGFVEHVSDHLASTRCVDVVRDPRIEGWVLHDVDHCIRVEAAD